jgi:predicted protein tyrosine phosphatase
MIYICNLQEFQGHARVLAPTHLASLVSAQEQPPTPRGMPAERHLKLVVHDISTPLPGYILAGEDHMDRLIAFLGDWQPDDGALLVHCMAGISRSTAAALIALVIKAQGREMEAALHLREAAPHAHPNRRLIALADQLLGCQGRLIAAREAMGPPRLAFSGPLVSLPLLG